MAPSRAVPLRRIASAFMQPHMRPTARLISTRTIETQRRRGVVTIPCSSTRSTCVSASLLRSYSSTASASPEPPDYLNEAELHVFNKIKAELQPVKLEVQDISGGCGSMYALEIQSPKFNGLTVIKQHKMVNEVLKDEIKSWHGVQLRTKST